MGNTTNKELKERPPRTLGEDESPERDHQQAPDEKRVPPALPLPVPLLTTEAPRTQEISVFGSPLMSPTPEFAQNTQTTAKPETSSTKLVTLQWRYPAKTVEVAGSFNDWQRNFTMSKNADGVFEVSVALKPGRHEIKYFVDSHWKHDPALPVSSSTVGSINNILEIETDQGLAPTAEPLKMFKPLTRQAAPAEAMTEVGDSFAALGEDLGTRAGSPTGDYGQVVPSFRDHKPPRLPPQLLQVTLNSGAQDDPTQVPKPSNINLNHLYALSIKDNVVVLGASHRYQKKFVTTVIYKLLYEDESDEEN